MNGRLRRVSAGIALGALAALVPAGARGATTPPPINVLSYPCSSNSGVGNFRGIRGEHDLLVGAPGDTLAGKGSIDGSSAEGTSAAGSANVIYPSSASDGFKEGLNPTKDGQFLSEASPGIARFNFRPGDGDAFGFSVATGDFNHDGFDDAALGAPGRDNRAGAVIVVYGGPGGLNTSTAQIFEQGVGGIAGVRQSGAEFGYALASGDFNGDGAADLAIGSPRYDGGTQKDIGVVNVIYGKARTPTSFGGLTTAGNTWFNEGDPKAAVGKPRAAQDNRFGAALAAGQFSDGASPDDLAIGAPGEDFKSAFDNGSVLIMHGSTDHGLTTSGEVFLYPGAKGMPGGVAQSGADFGCSLAAADFNGDHLIGAGAGADQDLAIGAPGWNTDGVTGSGAVFTVYNTGTTTGVSAVDPGGIRDGSAWHEPDFFSEDSPGIPGVATKGAHFGATLAAGNFNGDHRTTDGTELAMDLAIGEPNETVYGQTNAGSIRVIYGAPGIGLTDDGAAAFAQSPSDAASACYLYNTPIGAGCSLTLSGPANYSPLWMVAEKDDGFGAALAAGDFNNDGKDDIAIGVPGEDYGEFVNYITEEKAEIPPNLLPVSLSIDEQKDAGIVQIVNGPFPTPTTTPAAQQIIVRQGKDSLGGLGEAIRTQLLYNLPANLFVDDQIPSGSGQTTDIVGDQFGASTG
jgi:hypothetical protein